MMLGHIWLTIPGASLPLAGSLLSRNGEAVYVFMMLSGFVIMNLLDGGKEGYAGYPSPPLLPPLPGLFRAAAGLAGAAGSVDAGVLRSTVAFAAQRPAHRHPGRYPGAFLEPLGRPRGAGARHDPLPPAAQHGIRDVGPGLEHLAGMAVLRGGAPRLRRGGARPGARQPAGSGTALAAHFLLRYVAGEGFLPTAVAYFIVGAASYFLWRRQEQFPAATVAIGAALAAALGALDDQPAVAIWCAVLGLLMLRRQDGAARLPALASQLLRHPALVWVGTISYSLDLVHMIPLVLAMALMPAGLRARCRRAPGCSPRWCRRACCCPGCCSTPWSGRASRWGGGWRGGYSVPDQPAIGGCRDETKKTARVQQR